MNIEGVVVELEAIEDVRKELKTAQNNIEAWEILGRLVSLYSALNVTEIKEELKRVA